MQLSSETQFLLEAFTASIWGAFFYDGFRILRRVIPHSVTIVFVEDFSFWMVCAYWGLMIMYENETGGVRWFGILGSLLGIGIYKKTISHFLVKSVSGLFLCLRKKLTVFLKLFRIKLTKR